MSEGCGLGLRVCVEATGEEEIGSGCWPRSSGLGGRVRQAQGVDLSLSLFLALSRSRSLSLSPGVDKEGFSFRWARSGDT